jgi:hypothetical protein
MRAEVVGDETARGERVVGDCKPGALLECKLQTRAGSCDRMDPPLPARPDTLAPGSSDNAHQPRLLRRCPASTRLNRCDDLDPSVRHVTIPMNSHMTHTRIRSTRRRLPEG